MCSPLARKDDHSHIPPFDQEFFQSDLRHFERMDRIDCLLDEELPFVTYLPNGSNLEI